MSSSPESPSGYSHHPHHHPPPPPPQQHQQHPSVYSHQDSHPHPHSQQHSLQPLPPAAALPPHPSDPPPQPHSLRHQSEGAYRDERGYHYAERRSPYPPPPPHLPPSTFPPPPPPNHHHNHHLTPPPAHPHSESPEQPLDLSVSRSPRPSSAGAEEGGGGAPPPVKRPRLEEGSQREGEVIRGDHAPPPPPHSNVCMLRGCTCRSPMPASIQHAPQHYATQQHHSPYPQYPAPHPGRSSGSPVGEGAAYSSSSSHPYCIPHPSPRAPASSSSSSSPGMLYSAGGGGRSSSPYIPPPPDRHSRSPGMGMSYAGEVASQRPPSNSLLPLPPPLPPLGSVSPLSISTRDPSPSPCPPSVSQSVSRIRDVSPRPFYRPFEDPGHALADRPRAAPVISSTSSSSKLGAMESSSSSSSSSSYPSEDDLSASSTLLMLSNTTAEQHRPSVLATRQTADSSVDTFSPYREYRRGGEESHHQHHHPRYHHHHHHAMPEPSQSDSARAGFQQLPTMPSYAPKAFSADSHQLAGREARGEPYPPHTQPLGPAQDGTVASTYSSSSSDDLSNSPAPRNEEQRSRGFALPPHQHSDSSPSPKQPPQQGEEKKPKNLQSRLVKVVGTTPLAALREQRAKKQAEKVKEMFGGGGDQRHSSNSNDSEGPASDLNSSGQASPHSSDGSENNDAVGPGFPIPPDPNIKMSALDYLISKVLVERIDVPFKACNTEIKEIYTGAKKGRLTLVDLIELQVEASLKA